MPKSLTRRLRLEESVCGATEILPLRRNCQKSWRIERGEARTEYERNGGSGVVMQWLAAPPGLLQSLLVELEDADEEEFVTKNDELTNLSVNF